ncbi:MAG: hypothetical protein ABIR65_01160 [Pseudolysinimonas sp.]
MTAALHTVARLHDLADRQSPGPDRETCVLTLELITTLMSSERLALLQAATALYASTEDIGIESYAEAVDTARDLLAEIDAVHEERDAARQAARCRTFAADAMLWLRMRNHGQLQPAIGAMGYEEYQHAIDELATRLERHLAGGAP